MLVYDNLSRFGKIVYMTFCMLFLAEVVAVFVGPLFPGVLPF